MKKVFLVKSKKEKKEVISPITIIGLIIIFSIILTIGDEAFYITCLLLSLLSLSIYSLKLSFKFTLFLIVIFILIRILENYLGGVFIGSIYLMLRIIFLYAPIFIMARVMSLYSASFIVASFTNRGMPTSFGLPIALFFRFIPEIKIRLQEIKDGQKIRGFKTSIFHPIKTFELYFVPLLYKCLEISDVLTCSIILKGIEIDCKKTSIYNLQFSKFDYFMWVSTVIMLGASLWKM
ncbi:TPA: ABC transporter permease [Streptococcus pyogenes]|nr:ABC transporter permease [Streptococcus pyogenes]